MTRVQVATGLAVAVAVVVVVTILIVRSGSSDHPRVAPVSTTTSTVSSTVPATSSTTVPPSTTTATTTAPPPSSRRLYPAFLPAGVGAGALRTYTDSQSTESGYTQSYYGAPNAAGKPVELVIEARPARLVEGLAPAKFAGRDVMIWRSNTANNPVVAVTAKLSGRNVTLVSYALSERDLGAVLNGLRPRSNGGGWDAGVLPAGLRLFGEGDNTPKPSDVRYILNFGPFNRPPVQVSVGPGALLPEDTCICNPGLRRSLKTTTIKGIPAVLIDRSDTYGIAGSSYQITWQYAPDIVATVSVDRLDETTAVRIASSVGPADPATWAALPCVNAAGTTVACSSVPQVPASG